MPRSRLMKFIHVIGYVATLLVLAEGVWIGFQLWSGWRAAEARKSRMREASRTHDRALIANGDILETDAANVYGRVRPSAGSVGNVLGFVSMPSFGSWYAASLRLPQGSDVALGEIVSASFGFKERGSQLTFSQTQTFTLPSSKYLAAVKQIDLLSDGWTGSGDNGCFDGVPVAFERIRALRITSGVGNASCDPHYAAVDHIIEPLVRRFVPKMSATTNAAAGPA